MTFGKHALWERHVLSHRAAPRAAGRDFVIPQVAECGDIRGDVRVVPHADRNIDNRLGGQPRDRRAADMFDAQNNRPKNIKQALLLVVIEAKPSRVMVDDDNRLAIGATIRTPPLCACGKLR